MSGSSTHHISPMSSSNHTKTNKKYWINKKSHLKRAKLMRNLVFGSSKILCWQLFCILNFSFIFRFQRNWKTTSRWKIQDVKNCQNKIFELQKNKFCIKFALFQQNFIDFCFLVFKINPCRTFQWPNYGKVTQPILIPKTQVQIFETLKNYLF